MELILKNLTKEFKGFRAVDGISCRLRPGVYGLLGANGAGKTTLMRMLTTLMEPTAGSITWDNRDIFQMEGEYRRLLGYLPQEFGFYPEFTVQEYLLYIASLKGLRPGAARQRVKRLLAQVGLTQARNKKMKALSGGMKRRAGIAQAMLNDPRLLILDEPTAGLDPSERVRFRNLISELSRDRIVLLSTHIVSDVEYIADEILLMRSGVLAAQGTAEDLTRTPGLRVWRCAVSRKEAEVLLRKYPIANSRTLPGGTELRILSPTPPTAEAVSEIPTLEDVFLHYIGQKGGSHNDAL